MVKIYIALFILAMVGSVSGGVYFYYTSTQATIATLRENNAKLEVALETATASLETMKATVEKTNKLNQKLQSDLQAAEAYTDELRSKFSDNQTVVKITFKYSSGSSARHSFLTAIFIHPNLV